MDFNSWLRSFLDIFGLEKPPLSLIFLIVVVIGITFFAAWLSKLLINEEEMMRINKMINKHQMDKKRVIEEKDPRLFIKVKYNEERITEIQQSVAMKRFIPQMVVTIPYWIIFGVLRAVMGDPSLNADPSRGPIIAIFPFKIPSTFPLIGGWFSTASFDPSLSVAGFGSMYVLTAVVTSVFLSKILGINPNANLQPPNPLK